MQGHWTFAEIEQKPVSRVMKKKTNLYVQFSMKSGLEMAVNEQWW